MPPLIKEDDYNNLRNKLLSDEKFKINESDDLEEVFKMFKWKFIICIVLILFIPIDAFLKTEVFITISIIGLLLMGVILPRELYSFTKYLKAKREYYSDLERKIKLSKSYSEFVIFMT